MLVYCSIWLIRSNLFCFSFSFSFTNSPALAALRFLISPITLSVTCLSRLTWVATATVPICCKSLSRASSACRLASRRARFCAATAFSSSASVFASCSKSCFCAADPATAPAMAFSNSPLRFWIAETLPSINFSPTSFPRCFACSAARRFASAAACSSACLCLSRAAACASWFCFSLRSSSFAATNAASDAAFTRPPSKNPDINAFAVFTFAGIESKN